MPTRLDLIYQVQVRQVRQRLETFARRRFTARNWHDEDMAAFLTAVVPAVLAGRRQISALTDSYLASRLSASLGRRVRPRGPIDTDALRGIPAVEVYQRPFVTVRTKLSDGQALDAAVSAGLARTSDLVLTDLQLAKTHTVREVFSSTDGVHGYRRILSGGLCRLCSDASQQRYHPGDLMPIHPGCDCSVEELMEPAVPASGSGAVAVREHGEIGPVLTAAGHHFTSPSAI